MCPRAEPKATVVAWADNGHWLVQITIVGVIGRPYGRPIGLAPKERPSVVWDGPERAAPTMRGGPRKRWQDSGASLILRHRLEGTAVSLTMGSVPRGLHNKTILDSYGHQRQRLCRGWADFDLGFHI